MTFVARTEDTYEIGFQRMSRIVVRLCVVAERKIKQSIVLRLRDSYSIYRGQLYVIQENRLDVASIPAHHPRPVAFG